MQNIKTKDSNQNLKHFIKQQSIHSRQSAINNNQEHQETNTSSIATNQIQNTAEATAYETGHRIKKHIEKKYKQKKIQKQILNQKEQVKSPEQTDVSISIHHTTSSIDGSSTKVSYVSQAKSYVQSKLHASKIRDTAERIITRPFVQKTSKFVITATEVIKKAVGSINTLISFGTGLILVIVLTLFIGTFSVLAQDGGSNSLIQPLSDEVLAYEDTIRKYAEENGIEDYLAILEAIMMQESKGLGNDPMQCSESGYNIQECQME